MAMKRASWLNFLLHGVDTARVWLDHGLMLHPSSRERWILVLWTQLSMDLLLNNMEFKDIQPSNTLLLDPPSLKIIMVEDQPLILSILPRKNSPRTSLLQRLSRLPVLKMLKRVVRIILSVLLLSCLTFLIVSLTAETVTLRISRSLVTSTRRRTGAGCGLRVWLSLSWRMLLRLEDLAPQPWLS